jgi:hypothetical protein
MPYAAFFNALEGFLTGPAAPTPTPASVGAAEPVIQGDLPALVLSLDKVRSEFGGVGERSELVRGALAWSARIDLVDPVLPSDPSFRLLSADRLRLVLTHGGLVRTDGSPGALGASDIQVTVAGAPRTLVAGAPGPGEFNVDPSIGLLTFGAALPAAGEVVADYFLGQWERTVLRLEGDLRVDACDRDAATAVDLSDAVVAALAGPDVADLVEGIVTMRLSKLGSLGPPEKDFAQARRRKAVFSFQFEHVVDDPESSGGIIRRVPITTRLKALTTAHGIITEETVTESG